MEEKSLEKIKVYNCAKTHVSVKIKKILLAHIQYHYKYQ